MLGKEYLVNLNELMKKIIDTQYNKLEESSEVIFNSILNGNLLHIFGTGHAHLLVEEIIYREGGLVPINPILDEGLMLNGGSKTIFMERLEWFSKNIFYRYDFRKDDIMIIASNSGRNSGPIEMAEMAKKRGLFLIIITSLEHVKAVKSRHYSGKHAHEYADIVIDNCGPYGDAILQVDGFPCAVGPATTITVSFILDSIILLVQEKLNKVGALEKYTINPLKGILSKSEREKYEPYKLRIKHF